MQLRPNDKGSVDWATPLYRARISSLSSECFSKDRFSSLVILHIKNLQIMGK